MTCFITVNAHESTTRRSRARPVGAGAALPPGSPMRVGRAAPTSGRNRARQGRTGKEQPQPPVREKALLAPLRLRCCQSVRSRLCGRLMQIDARRRGGAAVVLDERHRGVGRVSPGWDRWRWRRWGGERSWESAWVCVV